MFIIHHEIHLTLNLGNIDWVTFLLIPLCEVYNIYILSTSSSEARVSRDHFFIIFFCLQTFMNCGVA